MIMRAEKTRQLQKRKLTMVIDPDSTRAITWQLITSCCMAFISIVTPVQVGLLELRLDFLQILSWGVDSIFFVDMVLQFFTMYPKTTPRGIEWETDLRKIGIHYMRTWFFLDFVTLIPFDILSLTWNAANLKELKSIKVIRAVRLLKLTLGSCFTSVFATGEKPVPKWIDDIAASDLEFKIVTRDHPLRIYMASFYFCSYTMTSVGYGDLGPKNILERVVCTAIVLVAGLCWAQILGDVCAISSDMNAENQEFRKKMNSLNRMMQEQGLPHDLRRRLRSFFLQPALGLPQVVRQKLLTNMSPQLQSEVCTEMNLPWIQKVSFFSQFINHMDRLESKGVDTEAFRACIADTSRQLVCGAFAQRESFGNVQILYILSKGLVILNSKVGTNGTVWGEDFVLADTSLIRPVSGFALTYIEVMALTRESFMKVIERRRVNCPELGQTLGGTAAAAGKRLRSQLPHKDLERVPQPPPINELEVYSPAHMPGAMWTEDDELEKVE
ncbi:unnamed protein product [Durusdinium trenchii]|uniref:Cyclic nucleotide-binding domain-containing protein n=1 Tax=Durusdinium trenchii TaxID=1381693 RepID=A0ABP0HTN6_9DINO